MDTGASLSIINISFVRGLGLEMEHHVLDIQSADNRYIKTAGLVHLHVEVFVLTEVVPFSTFDNFGSGK